MPFLKNSTEPKGMAALPDVTVTVKVIFCVFWMGGVGDVRTTSAVVVVAAVITWETAADVEVE